ncbi:hypothetical protein ACFLY5_01005 [Patescibacteria group bacterium]
MKKDFEEAKVISEPTSESLEAVEDWKEEKLKELDELLPEFEGKLFKCLECDEMIHTDEVIRLNLGDEIMGVCPHCCSKDEKGEPTGGEEVHNLEPKEYKTKKAFNFMRDFKGGE